MSSTSNLYAEKVFAEHPIALWSLDDTCDYVSLMNEVDQVSYTNFSSANLSESESRLIPIQGTFSKQLTASSTSASITLENIIDPIRINSEISTVSIGFYINTASAADISSVQFGYTNSDNTESVFASKLIVSKSGWQHVSETIALSELESYNLKFTFSLETNNIIQISGITVGQYSEEFHTESIGVKPIEIDNNSVFDGMLGVPANIYGLRDESGYYLASENNLYAKNFGVPMVYGASNTTKLYTNPDGPSLVVPGFGFLNKKGQFQDLTLEMWIRLESKTEELRKIVGPVASEDGIYIDGPFITLKINQFIGSHYVGEWYRPMLLDLRISLNSASLLINGVEVISLELDTETLEFPSKFNVSGKDQDWIAFYSYDDVGVTELDVVAIYPYRVSEVLAKRRFVYGQGVEFPENLNTGYNGQSVFIDPQFSDYTNTYSYPDIGRWNQGKRENISLSNNTIASPDHPMPNFVFNDSGLILEDWYTACQQYYEDNPKGMPYLTFKSIDNLKGYLSFDSLNFLSEQIDSFFVSFGPQVLDNALPEQTIIKLVNAAQNSYLRIYVKDSSLFYSIKSGSSSERVISQQVLDLSYTVFYAGLDIKKFVSSYSQYAGLFFSSQHQVKVIVGSDESFENQFYGEIYRISFASARSNKKILDYFDSDGIVLNEISRFAEYLLDTTSIIDGGYYNSEFEDVLDGGGVVQQNTIPDPLFNHIGTYTLKPVEILGEMYVDASCTSYWQDGIPAFYFGQYVIDRFGNQVYDADFLQFNIDFPEIENIQNGKYVTDSALVKTYITLQFLTDGALKDISEFTNTELLSENKYVVLSDSRDVLLNTKYEVVDGAVIYLPKTIPLDTISVGIHVELIAKNISYRPISIRSLQISSQAFNDTVSTSIGTRFGENIFPYSKAGLYYEYKSPNPFSITRLSSPYLYLTKDSGIRMLESSSNFVERGLFLPINQARSNNFSVGAAQITVMYPEQSFSTKAMDMLILEARDRTLKVVAETTPDRSRARLYVTNTLGVKDNSVKIFINGREATSPYINTKEWYVISLQFDNGLSFSEFFGNARLTGKFLFNAFNYYQLSFGQSISGLGFKTWASIKGVDNVWSDVKDVYDTWRSVGYVDVEVYETISPSDIYKLYTGTNRLTFTDNSRVTLKNYNYPIYANASWRTSVVTPV
jgi:hypothetical protein